MTAALTRDTLVKVLGPDGTTHHGGSGTWHLPTRARPGRWMPHIKNIAPCERGYHVCTVAQAVLWLGPTLWLVEVRGARIEQRDKSVHESARLLARIETWNDRAARLFAADCAEHSLHLFEAVLPADGRPRAAIKAARDYANGLFDAKHLTAAGAAAWDAARAAAGAAAGDAAWAAWAAAGAAAGDAAGAAAGDAAWAAARDAAGDAAWAAAGAAAWDAERSWQADRLLAYLLGEATP